MFSLRRDADGKDSCPSNSRETTYTRVDHVSAEEGNVGWESTLVQSSGSSVEGWLCDLWEARLCFIFKRERIMETQWLKYTSNFITYQLCKLGACSEYQCPHVKCFKSINYLHEPHKAVWTMYLLGNQAHRQCSYKRCFPPSEFFWISLTEKWVQQFLASFRELQNSNKYMFLNWWEALQIVTVLLLLFENALILAYCHVK